MVSGTLAPLYTVFVLKLDVRTDVRTENLPILQDFVPYRGRCPATAQLQPKNCIKQGKGTADHMMPLGDWFKITITEM